MSIQNWPATERPREKLLAAGPQSLTDAELVAVLLGSGIRGRSALDLARELLLTFGSLRQLFSADRERCTRALGVGPSRFCVLQAVFELARRHYLQALRDRAPL